MTGVDLSKLDSTNQVLQADPKAATSVKRAHQAAVDVFHAMNPPVPPPVGPPVIYVAPPLQPVTVIRNAAIGVNDPSTPKTIHDTLVVASTDTSYIVGVDANPTTIERCQATDVALHPSVTWAIHGIYGKSENLTVRNFQATGSPNATAGITLRYRGAVVQNYISSGFAFGITYDEENMSRVGTVNLIGWQVDYRLRALWIDVNGAQECVQHFVIRDAVFTGPNPPIAANTATWAGSMDITNAWWNGKPLTLADCVLDPPGAGLMPNVVIHP